METERHKTKRLVLDRPEERDLRVLSVVAGIDRLGRGNGLTPYELSIALKLALGEIAKANRAPMATIHQFRGYLLDLEAEMAEPEGIEEEGGEAA